MKCCVPHVFQLSRTYFGHISLWALYITRNISAQNIQTNKQTHTKTNKHINNQTDEQINKQTNREALFCNIYSGTSLYSTPATSTHANAKIGSRIRGKSNQKTFQLRLYRRSVVPWATCIFHGQIALTYNNRHLQCA